MRRHRRRWWVLRALSRNSLARSVDRLEAWTALVLVLVASIGAFVGVGHVSHAVSAAASKSIQREMTTRHPVESTVVEPSEARTQGSVTTFWTHVQWFDGKETRDGVVKVAKGVKVGTHVGIWNDEQGKLVPAPRSPGDAAGSGFGAGLVVFLMAAGVVGGLLWMMRALLDRRRLRAWDRALQILARNGGGSSAHNS